MKRTRILNDTHLGVSRKAGTTPTSVLKLREWTQEKFHDLIHIDTAPRTVILGDLFDKSVVDGHTLLRTFNTLSSYVRCGNDLIIVEGNHDNANNSTLLSAVRLLAEFLEDSKGSGTVTLVADKPVEIDGMLIVPHVTNQDEFSEVIQGLSNEDNFTHLLLHCNYDNGFAIGQDQSLNFCRDWAENLSCKLIIVAHEHGAREVTESNVVILGNQFPTSISDCLTGDKFRWEIGEENEISPTLSWEPKSEFVEVNHDRIADIPRDARFVRIAGEVDVDEFSLYSKELKTLRANHDAFVISSVVQAKATVSDKDFGDTVNEITTFKVIPELLKHISDDKIRVAIEQIVSEMGDDDDD